MQVIDDSNDELSKYYFKLGQHYASIKEYKMAEKFYMQGNTHKTAIEMYNSAGMWEEAHSLASQYMAADEVSNFHRHYQITQALFLCAPFLSKMEIVHLFSSSTPTPRQMP